jgi:peptide methionine sulfoxide reductase MsrA
VPGVDSAVSGYTGGAMESPTYHDHGAHIEAILVSVRPARPGVITR